MKRDLHTLPLGDKQKTNDVSGEGLIDEEEDHEARFDHEEKGTRDYEETMREVWIFEAKFPVTI